ncbi:MAG: hypothetical protein CSA38_04380 [Flavobacteriales bacterium]|nr:MAG: hypothetical protein CSA38_04380 [Flavobacteriales bacterium]
MKLSEFKEKLNQVEELHFVLENGEKVPAHFHITEVGQINKHFIDCGGVERKEMTVNFQLWTSIDTDHRLKSEKLQHIIQISEEKLHLQDAEIEVEYQLETIGKFGIDFKEGQFILTSKLTNCLAPDQCGLPSFEKKKVKLSELNAPKTSCCEPSSGCC